MTDDEFDTLVADALDQVPEEFQAAFENLGIFVADSAPEGEDMLGVYEGVPLTERGDFEFGEPDTITIFKQNILNMCETEDEVREEVLVTVVHEIAHYFGIEDDRLHELGWG